MDFISQLIQKNIIEKYYIYFTPFFNIDGSLYSEPYLELGRLPNPFEAYSHLSSYSPLSNKYPKKWSIHLSHILFGNFNPNDIPKENQKPIFEIKHEKDHVFRIVGESIERTYNLINISTDEGLMKLISYLEKIEIEKALKEKGAVDGDTVLLCDFEFEYLE